MWDLRSFSQFLTHKILGDINFSNITGSDGTESLRKFQALFLNNPKFGKGVSKTSLPLQVSLRGFPTRFYLEINQFIPINL